MAIPSLDTKVQCVSIGLTTHDEIENISSLLDSLVQLVEQGFPVILFDDASTDGTDDAIRSHPIFSCKLFRAEFATQNSGGPSRGRAFIANEAVTEYVTFVDGDDHIDPRGFSALARQLAGRGYEMILTPYFVHDTRYHHFDGPPGAIPINSTNLPRLVSGIGGRIYNTRLIARYLDPDYVGGFEDAATNLQLLTDGHVKAVSLDVPFYWITSHRKSMTAKNIDFAEIAKIFQAYQMLALRFGTNRAYLISLRGTLRRAVEHDSTVSQEKRRYLLSKIDEVINFKPKRMVMLCTDLSGAGGVPTRVSRLLDRTTPAGMKFQALTLTNIGKAATPNSLCAATHPKETLTAISAWDPAETVVVSQSWIIELLPKDIAEALRRFPLVYFGDAQMSLFVHHTPASVAAAMQTLRFTKIVALSEGDIVFQRQLGITGQKLGTLPVDQRESNDYVPRLPLQLGYVGVTDFGVKATDLLTDYAEHLPPDMPPIRVFTTSDQNSADVVEFVEGIKKRALSGKLVVTLNQRDKTEMFPGLGLLVVPSKMESFGLSILEAFSFGVPVVAYRYAPGPARLIQHGVNGLLLDDMRPSTLFEALGRLDEQALKHLSEGAFQTHRNYTPAAYEAFLDELAQETLSEFSGANTLPIFPSTGVLAPTVRGHDIAEIEYLKRVHQEMLGSNSWRVTKPLRMIMSVLRRAKPVGGS